MIPFHRKTRTIITLLLFFTLIWLVPARSLSVSAAPNMAIAGGNEGVKVWLTDLSGSARLSQQQDISFAPDSGFNPLTITVEENIQFQQMVGFGASFTDSSAWLVYNKLNAAQRDALMTSLFSPSSGIGLGLLRQPLGASDFSTIGNYSYDDMPAGQSDPGLNNFSINHDTGYIIPVLKKALQLNPSLKIIGTPWSPPGWMKSSGSMIGGNLKPEAYNPLANYFVKYIQAYEAQGLTVDYITPQNEPLFIPSGYPGMGMSASEQASFIKNNLGPALATNQLSTKILAYDHNWDQPTFPQTVLTDPGAAQFVAGIAWHWYGGEVGAQTTVHNQYPNKDTFITEASGGTWQGGDANGFRDALSLVINGSRNWARGVVLWNMALDTNRGPTNGGCDTCRGVVTIDQNSGNVTYNVDYYALGHASRFVKGGAYHIGSNTFGSNLEDVAFKNPDGSKVLLVRNAGSNQSTFKVVWGDESFSYTLNAGAAVTFTWTGSPRRVAQMLSRQGWIASAGTSATNTPPANTLDGNALTRWSTGQPQANGQWFQIDLGSAQAFDRLVLDSVNGEYPRGYQLFVSRDGTTWGNTIASGAGAAQTTTINFPSQIARYVRLVQTAADGATWSISEVGLFASRATGALPRGGWNVAASSSNGGEPAANAIDGNNGTRWTTGQAQSNGQWFQVDLGAPQTFFAIELDAGPSVNDYPRGFQVYVSNDGNNWGSPIASGAGHSQLVSVTATSQTARYIRVIQTGSAAQWWSVHEFNVLAAVAPTSQPPSLITVTDNNRSLALDSVLFMVQPFSLVNTLNFSSDQRTRIMLFTANLGLLQGEDQSAVSALAIDSQNTVYPLVVEYAGTVPGYNWLSSVIIKLPDSLSINGEISLSVTVHGQSSNAVILALKAP